MYSPSDISQFASGEVPVWAGFSNVFALEVQRAGNKLNIIYPDDYGIHFYGDIMTDDRIAKNPDLVQRFALPETRSLAIVSMRVLDFMLRWQGPFGDSTPAFRTPQIQPANFSGSGATVKRDVFRLRLPIRSRRRPRQLARQR